MTQGWEQTPVNTVVKRGFTEEATLNQRLDESKGFVQVDTWEGNVSVRRNNER